jgi:glutamate dehydrogenase
MNADAGTTQRQDEVLGLVRTRLMGAQRDTLERFVARYFGQVDPEDLEQRAPADLYGAALSHWNFARRRTPGQARVRVFNPTIDEHGWQSTHTIIEIVNDDMPFLVDSVTMEVNRHGLTLHLIVHPVVPVQRDDEGTLIGVAAETATGGHRESFIHVEVDRIVEPERRDALAADVSRVLTDVRLAVADWKRMKAQLERVLAEIGERPPPIPPDELAEGKAFLAWLGNEHFTFVGYRCHDLVEVDGEDALKIVTGSSLGILRETPGKNMAASFAALPPEVRAYARRPDLLIVTKSNARSTVHRPGYLDYGHQRFDAAGKVCGEHRFLPYTARAYGAKPADSVLRRKIANVMACGLRKAATPQGARQHSRQLPARRAVPDQRGRALQHGDGHPAPRRAAAVSPLRPARRVPALPRVHDLRAARELHDGVAREVAGDPAEGVQRNELGIQRAALRVSARARAGHRADHTRADSALRRPRARGAARSGCPPLG